MFKGRGGVLLFIIIIVLVIAAFLYLRGDRSLPLIGRRADTPTIPLDVQSVVPPGWTVQSEPQLQCDFDNDNLREWLIVYRYNSTTLPVPLAREGTTLTSSPFGGVIYDTQADTLEPRPGSPGPYRASNLVPYKLLPDFYPGKGQGYLGETSVTVRYAPAITEGETCKTDEINIWGFSGGQLPTRLSVFRWAGTTDGYQGPHFTGDARVESTANAGGQIISVTTYNRLRNHRSVLCEVAGNLRPDVASLNFITDAAVQTIDFCFGPPSDPVYPEGVVVAVLRSAPAPSNTDSPRYILDNAIVPAELQFLREPGHAPVNIVVMGNPSSVEAEPARGRSCTVDDISTADKDALWCERERVRVETRIMLDGAPRDVVWILISVIPNRPNADLYWRVQEIELS